ncbi:hypothetical protein BKA57DRAFT_435192 [Linnemannia elongata]|nr:hypothetical protein BKA57DRAFT_435192 [Linnemannia elongata]
MGAKHCSNSVVVEPKLQLFLTDLTDVSQAVSTSLVSIGIVIVNGMVAAMSVVTERQNLHHVKGLISTGRVVIRRVENSQDFTRVGADPTGISKFVDYYKPMSLA